MNQAEETPEKASVGALGTGAAVGTGLVAGMWASVASVNHALKENFREYFTPYLDFLAKTKKYAAKPKNAARIFPNDISIGNMSKEAVIARDTLHIAAEDAGAMPLQTHYETPRVAAINDSGSVLGDALEKWEDARRTPENLAHLDRQLEQSLAPSREALKGGAEQLAVKAQMAQDVITASEQAVEHDCKLFAKEVPWSKKLLLSSDLHLTGGQKVNAVTAFAVVTGVAAGAFYLALKAMSPVKEKAEAPLR